jgi:hypothetical protein
MYKILKPGEHAYYMEENISKLFARKENRKLKIKKIMNLGFLIFRIARLVYSWLPSGS